jgi:hypothetical protein
VNLAEAVTQFESRFKSVVEFDPKQTDREAAPSGEKYREVCPGGLREQGEPDPVLCASERVAAVLWLQSAAQLAGKHKTLYWHTKPQIEWRQITEADARQTQRVVGNRCAVYSRMAFGD